jgi:hypothetical protein
MLARPIDFDYEPEEVHEDDYASPVCDCDLCLSAVPLAA